MLKGSRGIVQAMSSILVFLCREKDDQRRNSPCILTSDYLNFNFNCHFANVNCKFYREQIPKAADMKLKKTYVDKTRRFEGEFRGLHKIYLLRPLLKTLELALRNK